MQDVLDGVTVGPTLKQWKGLLNRAISLVDVRKVDLGDEAHRRGLDGVPVFTL